jgi:hypothetical protein
MLLGELHECLAELAEVEESTPAVPKTRTRTRTRTIVKNNVVERIVSCAADPPVIEKVKSTPCQGAYICLDTKAQLVLAKNLAAYEAFVRRCRARGVD